MNPLDLQTVWSPADAVLAAIAAADEPTFAGVEVCE